MSFSFFPALENGEELCIRAYFSFSFRFLREIRYKNNHRTALSDISYQSPFKFPKKSPVSRKIGLKIAVFRLISTKSIDNLLNMSFRLEKLDFFRTKTSVESYVKHLPGKSY